MTFLFSCCVSGPPEELSWPMHQSAAHQQLRHADQPWEDGAQVSVLLCARPRSAGSKSRESEELNAGARGGLYWADCNKKTVNGQQHPRVLNNYTTRCRAWATDVHWTALVFIVSSTFLPLCLKSPPKPTFTVLYFSLLKVHLKEWIKMWAKSKAASSDLPVAYIIEAVSFQISHHFIP